MPSGITLPASFALTRRLAALRDLPRSDEFARFRRDVREIVVRGHADTLLSGKDGRGQPMAPLSFNTIRSRKGSGPPLVPHGEQSRLIRNFDTLWDRDDDRTWVLERRIGGVPWARYHISGTRNMPKRDYSAIAPITWARLIKRNQQFLAEIGRAG